jgi:myo-inositol-1(or 4)-monophosphatase
MLKQFVDTALEACIEVCRLIDENSDHSAYESFERGAGGDVSIGFDLMAEAVFARYLKPFGTLLSEESGRIEGEGDALIILDPIDGSDNLKSHVPYYGAAIAYQCEGRTEAALICNFSNGDCFIKYHGKHVKTSLFHPDVCEEVTPHKYAKVGLFERVGVRPEFIAPLLESGLKFRSPGAVALSLAYAHYVKYVVFFGTMRPYDLDAGLYLCENLHIYQDDGLLFVAKDQAVFDKLSEIFLKA